MNASCPYCDRHEPLMASGLCSTCDAVELIRDAHAGRPLPDVVEAAPVVVSS